MTINEKILITGDRGYIGSVLAPTLVEYGYDVQGIDTGYYEDCLLATEKSSYVRTNTDIRDIQRSHMKGVDAIIHLAGLSNDPLGELAPGLTEQINFQGTLRLALLARSEGVKRFIYASSQSMYGVSDSENELEEDSSEKNPVTTYAKTKWDAEVELKKLITDDFSVVCFRPSTVFGVSPRIRCDIVFNNLVACAYTTGRIEIKSDGSPWRPVVHVRDVCSAFISGLQAPLEKVRGRSFNVGIPTGNFTVRDLAEAAQRSVPGSTLLFTGEHGLDSRTYRVSFNRILTELSDYYKPSWDLDRGGRELVEFFKNIGFTEQDFRGERTIRLAKLRNLIDSRQIDSNLRWIRK